MAQGKDQKSQEESPGYLERLLSSRTIIISGVVDSELAQKVIQQFVLLDQEGSGKPIKMLINSPGGEVFSGFAIFDMMRFVSSPITTVVMGLAASMGSILALAPPNERRLALPNAKFMIHQPLLMGYQGKATDIEIQAREILRDRDRIAEIYHAETGRSLEDIATDIDRDNWMTAEEAKDYGLISKIVSSSSELD